VPPVGDGSGEYHSNGAEYVLAASFVLAGVFGDWALRKNTPFHPYQPFPVREYYTVKTVIG